MKTPLLAFLIVLAGGIVGAVSAQTATPASAPAPSGVPADITAEIAARRAELAKQQTPGTVGAPPSAIAGRGGPIGPPVLATATAPGGITITARSINESRNSSRGSMNIQINVTGTEFQPGTMLRQATVSNAVDNTGRSLLQAASNPLGGRISMSPLSMALQMGAAVRGRAVPGPVQLNGNIQLSAASRDAESIKLVEGELEIFAPSESNGSMIVIKDVKTKMGKPLEELRKVGIELILLTPESLPAVQARMTGRGGSQPNFGPNSLPVFYSDPEGVLVGFVLRDGNGVPLQIGGGGGGGGGNANATLYEFSYATPVPPDAQLSAYVQVPQAVSSVSYRLENLPLP